MKMLLSIFLCFLTCSCFSQVYSTPIEIRIELQKAFEIPKDMLGKETTGTLIFSFDGDKENAYNIKPIYSSLDSYYKSNIESFIYTLSKLSLEENKTYISTIIIKTGDSQSHGNTLFVESTYEIDNTVYLAKVTVTCLCVVRNEPSELGYIIHEKEE